MKQSFHRPSLNQGFKNLAFSRILLYLICAVCCCRSVALPTGVAALTNPLCLWFLRRVQRSKTLPVWRWDWDEVGFYTCSHAQRWYHRVASTSDPLKVGEDDACSWRPVWKTRIENVISAPMQRHWAWTLRCSGTHLLASRETVWGL